MPGFSMSALSTQYVTIPVRAMSNGQPYNPTADSVQVAFVSGWTEPTTWYTGGWGGTTAANGYYLAQMLVSPAGGTVSLSGTVSLAQGSYAVWLKITDSPEVPVINTGTLVITP